MKKISAVIVDDESGAIRTLKKMLESYCPEVKIIGTAENIDRAEQLLSKLEPQLIFLDIHMPDGSGIDLLDQYSGNAKVIFTTAYGEYTINAIRLSAFDYLLKPIKKMT